MTTGSPVAKHGSPGDPGYRLLHPGGKSGGSRTGGKTDATSIKTWAAGLSAGDRKAVLDYQKLNYVSVNGALRDRWAAGPAEKRSIADLDRVIDEAPPLDKAETVYRAIQHDRLAQVFDRIKPGVTISDGAFQSTTRSPDIAKRYASGESGVLAEIRLPAGTKAINVAEVNDHAGEQELLLHREVTYKVVSASTDNDGMRRLVLDLVEDQAQKARRRRPARSGSTKRLVWGEGDFEMAGLVDKSAGDKANPTGEARAAKLIAWFNAGAGGKIRWGLPGDFDACVRIAGKHMRPDLAKGFCSNRHKDATGARPGKAPAERRMHKAEVPAAIVTTDADGRQVVTKLAGLRLEVIDGPGLLITYGDTVVQLDGGDVPEGATHLTTTTGPAEDGGHFDSGGLSIDPRTVPGGWAYEVKVEGRRVLWMPAARSVPEWAKGADLVFVAGGVETPAGFPARRLRPADDAGTSYLLRQAGMAKSPARKALLKRLGRALMMRVEPAPGAQLLVDKRFEGGGEWEHVSFEVDVPAGVTSVTPYVTAGAGAGVTLDKALNGERTYEERRELVDRALRLAYANDTDVWAYVRTMTDDAVVFELSGKTPDAGLYRARYQIDAFGGEVAFGDPEEVEERKEYVPKATTEPLGSHSEHTWASVYGSPPPVMKAVAGPAIKSVDAKRYTMAPLYPASPESPSAAHLDAHGDFATAEDLQAAVWDHVRKGDRTIRDQHRAGTAIGEWVEIMSWPYEVTVPMTTADGTTVQKSFAPGTVFLGVVWNELGWSDITKGVKTGFSLGGVATRVAVEMT